MSWIVRELLSNAETIKSTADIESDEFNNFIILEKKIKEMSDKKLFTTRESDLIHNLKKGFTILEISQLLNSNRMTISKSIDKLCDKIAFQLGGEFTDDGYLAYMKESYHLSNKNVEDLHKFIHGRFSRKLARKGTND